MSARQGQLTRFASAPVSWGVWERTIAQDGLIEPVTMLDAVSSLGFDGIELAPGGYFGASAADVRAATGRFGLMPAGAFVELRLSDEDGFVEDLAVLDEAAALLAELPGSPPMLLADAGSAERRRASGRPEELVRTALPPTDLRRAAERAERAAERCLRRGVAAAFHPHAASCFEAPAEWYALLELTDPDLLGICLDTGHCVVGGGDPVELAEACESRLMHIHVKDVSGAVLARVRRGELDIDQAWAEGLFCAFGEGEVDLSGFLRPLTMRQFSGWVVLEQDRVAVGPDRLEEVRAVEEANLAHVLDCIGLRG